MKFEDLFKEIGKTIDEVIEKAPEVYKKTIEEPIKEVLEDIEEKISEVTEVFEEEIVVNVNVKNIKKKNLFVDIDNKNNIVYIGVHGKKKDSLIFEVKLPKKIDMDSIEAFFEEGSVRIKGKFKEAPLSENERIVVISEL